MVFVSLFLIEERKSKKEGQLEEEKGKEKNMEKGKDSGKKKGGKEGKRKQGKKIKSFVQKEVCFSVMVHLIITLRLALYVCRGLNFHNTQTYISKTQTFGNK